MKTNFQFFLNSYADFLPTTTPSQNNFKWLREINGVPYSIENSQQIQIAPSTTTPELIPYPFSTIVASPSASLDGTTANVTITGSPTGIVAGQLIAGAGVQPGTVVKSITGTAMVMSLPSTAAGSPRLDFYNPGSFLYMESDQQISVIYNGGTPFALNPFEINGLIQPGVFFLNGPIYSLSVTNPGTILANVFIALMG